MADAEQCFDGQPTILETDCAASVLECSHLKGVTKAPHKTADCRHMESSIRRVTDGRVVNINSPELMRTQG